MTAPRLADFLAAPAHRLSLDELAGAWFQARISARLPGYAALAHDLELLRRIRGGVGAVLKRAASPEAIAGHPCPWSPPCALDVLFREQLRQAAHGLPKPFVLRAEPKGADLIVSLTLFGEAAEWSGFAVQAFSETLQHGIDWQRQRADLFLPRPVLCDVRVVGLDGVDAMAWRPSVGLVYQTPMDAEGDDPIERPATVFARLARRVEGLARWHGMAVDVDWQHLGAAWSGVSFDTRCLVRAHVIRRSGSKGTAFGAEVVGGTLRIDQVPQALWPLLLLGQETHVGRGANAGFGRYLLV